MWERRPEMGESGPRRGLADRHHILSYPPSWARFANTVPLGLVPAN